MAATFKITASLTGQTTVLKGTATAPLKHKINEPDIYHIETIAAGHLPLKQDLDAEEMTVGQVFNYEAKLTTDSTKPTAPVLRAFSFKIIDNQTQRSIPNLRFSIANQTTRRLIPVRVRGTEARANLRIGETYLVEARANGYEPVTLRLETGEMAKRNEYLTNLTLNPLKKSTAARNKAVVNEKIFDNIKAGQSLSIEDNVYFDQSSYILRPEAHGQLNRLAAIMARNTAIKIEIVGHTDNVGDPRLNQILSEQRAKVIANYLINQGVSEANISHRGEGQTKPLAPNDTEENRQRNRRVQFLVMSI
jgi:outer membrane protein OmpA-like peptidoglycan-associated protein